MRPAALSWALFALLLAPAALASEAAPSPLVYDIEGDANGLGLYHVPGGQVRDLLGDALDNDPFGGGVSTGPASTAGSDILSLGYETSYDAVPVGADGIDYRATGLRVHLRTAAQPGAPVGSASYIVFAHLTDGFGTTCRTSFGVTIPEGGGAGTYPVTWSFENQFTSICPRPSGAYTHPDWTAQVTATGITMTFPMSGLAEEERFVIDEGVPFTRTLGITRVSAAQMDRSPFGPSWSVGQDMPADVPCTTGCP